MGKTIKKIATIAIGVGLIVVTAGTLAAPTLFGSAFFGSLAVSAGAGLILSGASGLLLKKPKIAGSNDLWGQLQLRADPTAPRWICYGEASTGGTLVYRMTTGTNNNTLRMAIVLAGHEIDSITGFKWGGEGVSFSSNNAVGTYANKMYRYDKPGTDAQTVETNLDAASAAWTTDHRLRGIAYVTMKLLFDESVLNQVKNTLFTIKGRKLYDPRLDSTNGGTGSHRYADHSTWAWSDNPALCIADYLMGIRVANSATTSYDGQIIAGLGIDPARIDWASIAAESNACDESVSLKAGSSEPRYTCNGFIDPRRSHRDNLAQLVSSMGGVVVFQSGKWSIYAAVTRTAVKSRDETNIIGGINYVAKASRSEIANCVRGVYSDAGSDHAPKDYPPIINSTYVTEDGGDELWLDIDLPMTTSGTMAQRLSKIALERTRRPGRVTASFQPIALQDQAMDALSFTYAPFNLSSQKMLVADWSLKIGKDENGNSGIVIQQTLVEEADAIYSWTPATDEQTIPARVSADTPARIADQRAIVPQSAGGIIVAVGTAPLSATDAGASATINVAAHTYQYGFGTVSVNAGSITGLNYLTTYYVYFDDLNREGGAVSYVATTSKTVVAAANSRTLVGGITTPASSAPDTGAIIGEGGLLS